MAEFEAFPKIPRLNRDITVTEKIDGTNAAVIVEKLDHEQPYDFAHEDDLVTRDGAVFHIQAQSRKRLIAPGKQTDNYGFAGWVRGNKEELFDLLGVGRHFGEWWGTGIQHGYGLIGQRNFSLFNPEHSARPKLPVRLSPPDGMTEDTCVDVVPVLYRGPFLDRDANSSTGELPHEAELWGLRNTGSVAAPGFTRPEGIIVFHEASRVLFKVTLENDEKPKEVVARETAKVAANGGGKVDFS